MLTIAPEPRATIARAAACPTRNAPLRLVRSTASKSASVSSMKSALLMTRRVIDQDIDTPAPLESGVDQAGRRRAHRPHRLPRSGRSHRRRQWPRAPPRRLPRRCPRARHRRPSSANRRAIASPMPRAAPVTIAVLACNRMVVSPSIPTRPGELTSLARGLPGAEQRLPRQHPVDVAVDEARLREPGQDLGHGRGLVERIGRGSMKVVPVRVGEPPEAHFVAVELERPPPASPRPTSGPR